MQKAHEVDFTVYGDDIQFVEIGLDPGESIIAEAGAMMYMDSAIQMDSIFGDGSGKDADKGFMGKLMGAGKRVVSFAAPYPGKIISLDLSEYSEQIVCQRDAFLCAAKGISVDIAFQKKIGAGFFGGD